MNKEKKTFELKLKFGKTSIVALLLCVVLLLAEVLKNLGENVDGSTKIFIICVLVVEGVRFILNVIGQIRNWKKRGADEDI